MSKHVYLSPSMQEGNIGAGDYGTEEKRMNQVCDVTERVLKDHGVTVSRNNPKMTLKEIVADSNKKKVDIHFAIHSNASGRSAAGKARGGEVYCYRFGSEGERLARAIYARLSPITPTTDKGVKESHSHFGPGKPMYEVAYTKAPAVLVEIAFHDNTEDAKWIMANIQMIGMELARGVLNYFGIEYKAPAPPVPPERITAGTVVEVNSTATTYYPGYVKIPDWVKEDYYHKVTQTTAFGRPVMKGGKVCVLLGKKIRKTDGKELIGINTWIDVDHLVMIKDNTVQQSIEVYTVKKGDTLWTVALAKLGSGLRYPEIIKLNRLKSTSLQIGQKLKLPKKD
ncbi:MAG: N-acetylmuramoyl-L-alanine amidase [Saccharofermentanales bacterium]